MSTASHAGTGPASRLASLDAYRGFVMLAMASAGLGIADVAAVAPENVLWSTLDHQVEHAIWRGCTAWDLIQPSFMFIVGVAMPFSYASRRAKGQSWGRMFVHALWRSAILVALGVFLASAGGRRTNWIFTNVLAQIGLGYPFVFLLLGAKPRVQFAAAMAILLAYWAAFVAFPEPTPETPFYRLALAPDAERLNGLGTHWLKHTNAAAAFDRWFLNLFPRETPYEINEGGYATLNFVPSIATMLFGVLAGGLLRSTRSGQAKLQYLMISAAVALVVSLILDPWACPIVKRIWTPTWALHSAGWACGLLAIFYGIIEVRGFRAWAFPLVVAGSNSIALYLMSQLLKPFTRETIKIHLGRGVFALPFGPVYAPMVQSIAVLAVFWLVAYAMYRQRIFLRI